MYLHAHWLSELHQHIISTLSHHTHLQPQEILSLFVHLLEAMMFCSHDSIHESGNIAAPGNKTPFKERVRE